jgi:outer membrane receptor protein involved in Fe transport
MRSRWLSAFMVLAFAAAGLVANVAYSQGSTTGDMEGTVSDTNGSPLPGVSVEARSRSLQGTRTIVTSAAGRFRFSVLPPGAYTVTATLAGFAKVERSNQIVTLGGTTSLSIAMQVSLKEEIIVTGETPVIDTTKTAIGLNRSADEIAKLPITRNYSSVAFGAPGTGTDVAGGVTVYGATSLENQYVIDGVNTSAVKGYNINGGGLERTGGGNQGKTLNPEFVQEVEVRTGGYEAEFGRALGGVINVITKSGGNEFHGGVFGYYDPSALASKDAREGDEAAAGLTARQSPKRFDIGLNLGGFFVKDRVWFFGAYDRINRDTDYLRQLTGRTSGDPNGTTRCGVSGQPACPTSGGVTADRDNTFSGKLTFRLGESNTVAVSVFGDPGSTDKFPQGGIGPDSVDLAKYDTGATDVTAKYDGIFGTQFLAQAQFSLHQEKNFLGPSNPAAAGVIGLRKVQTGFLSEYYPTSGFDGLIQDEKYKRYNYRGAGTLFFAGHEIKVGADYEDLSSSFTQAYPGPASAPGSVRLYYRANGAFRYNYSRYYSLVPIGLNCLLKADGTKPAPGEFVSFGGYGSPNCLGYAAGEGDYANPITKNLAVFGQDSWKVLRNLTINAGIRYEQQNVDGIVDDPYAQIKLKNEWSPRAGVVWDPLNNGKSKVFGSFGRFYTTVPQDIQTRSLGREALIIALTSTNKPVLDPIANVGFGFVQTGDYVNPGVKGMYQDEIIGGFEYEFLRDWTLGVKGVYKALGRVMEDRCDLIANPDAAAVLAAGQATNEFLRIYAPSCAIINVDGSNTLNTIKDPADPKCYPNGSVDPNTGGYVPSSPCTATQGVRYYRGVQADIAHRFSQNFMVQASYIYSKLEGNYSGNLSQTREGGQFDPNINADFDYPGLVTNSFGLLRNDQTHQLKVTGFYSFPFGLSVGANYNFHSGRPRNIIGCTQDVVACNSGYDQEGYLVPKGTAGRMPSVWEADLQFEYALHVGSVSIVPVIQIFNVFNRQAVISDMDLYNNQSDASLNVPCQDPKTGKTGFFPSCAPNVNYGRPVEWQRPRSIRVGGRISF